MSNFVALGCSVSWLMETSAQVNLSFCIIISKAKKKFRRQARWSVNSDLWRFTLEFNGEEEISKLFTFWTFSPQPSDCFLLFMSEEHKFFNITKMSLSRISCRIQHFWDKIFRFSRVHELLPHRVINAPNCSHNSTSGRRRWLPWCDFASREEEVGQGRRQQEEERVSHLTIFSAAVNQSSEIFSHFSDFLSSLRLVWRLAGRKSESARGENRQGQTYGMFATTTDNDVNE